MDIIFATPRSGFLKICADVIFDGRKELESGGIIRINFDKRGGYAGRVLVTKTNVEAPPFGRGGNVQLAGGRSRL